MKRLLVSTFLIPLLVGAASKTSVAQGTPGAEALNDEGKKLFKEERYFEASKRFKQAASISPQGKYYFNLCFSLNYLERFQEAIDACELVQPNGADQKLIEKTNAALNALRQKVPAQTQPNPTQPVGTDPGQPVGTDPGQPVGTDPGQPVGTDPGQPVGTDPGQPVGTDPGQPGGTGGQVSSGPAKVEGFDPFATQAPKAGYKWSIGGSVAGLSNSGLGDSEFRSGFLGDGGARLNLEANFMFQEEQQLGLQGQLGFTSINGNVGDDLFIIDAGVAAYKHFSFLESFSLTPLAGVGVSLMQPDDNSDSALLALNLRLQGTLDYSFGQNAEHLISVGPAVNIYSAASDAEPLLAQDYGLDEGGASLEFGVGYSYRFKTAFGDTPIFSLE